MESIKSEGLPFFESSENGGSGIQSVNMDDDECDNFQGFDFEESEFSQQPTDVVSMIVSDNLPDLSAILARERERKKKKGVKKIKKNEYDKIIDELQVYAESQGFKDDYIALIWELVSSQTTALNCVQRRKMIFQMLPERKIGHKIINTILYWLREEKGCKPTVLTAVYQLLILYYENRLDEDSEIISTNTVNCILAARTENFIIPWKTRLFRNIVSPEILTMVTINALKKLLHTNAIKKTQQDDIHATLGLCKHMRPDLFSDDALPPWKMRVLKYPADVSRQFYNAKVRIQNGRPAHHPLEDKIFPEFLPDCNASSARKTILVEMLACLDSEENTTFLAMNPVLLQVFEEWLKPILNYRFHHFTGYGSREDELRYSFILSRIDYITRVRQEGLKVITDWLANTLTTWDFWIFNDIIVTLLTYIPPQDALEHREMLENKFLRQFRCSTSARVSVWKILVSWFFGWTEAEPIEGSGDESSLAISSIVDCRKWLLTLMKQCVEVTMATIIKSDYTEEILKHFSGFIKYIGEFKYQIDYQSEETRDVFEDLSSTLLCINRLAETIPALELD